MGSGSGTATIIAALITGIFTAIVASIIGYLLGDRRHRFERIYERRAEVVAGMSEKLHAMQRALVEWMSPFQSSLGDREEQRSKANRALDDLISYHEANSLWLDPRTSGKIESFLTFVYELGHDYSDELNEKGHPGSSEGRKLARRALTEIQPLRRELEAEFRAIIYPQPWFGRTRAALVGLRARIATIPSNFRHKKDDK